MRIETVHVRRFRSLLDTSIAFDQLTAIVGPNGAGKSALFRALQVFYDQAGQVVGEDYYNRDDRTPIRIAVTFAGLMPEETTLYAPYIHGGRLTVTKVITSGGTKYH